MERRPAAPDAWWWIFDPRRSLRARAALVIGGGTILFTLLLTWFAGAIFRRQLLQQTGPVFETLAFQVSDKIDRALAERYAQVQFAANLAPMRSADLSPMERRHFLEAVLYSAGDFAWVGLVDARGTVVSGTQGWFENVSLADRPWFRAARTRPYAGNVHAWPELDRLLGQTNVDGPGGYIDFAAPVTSAQGQFLGVVCAQVRWHSWPRDVQFSVLPESANRARIEVTIYSSTGDVLLDSGGSGGSNALEAPGVRARRGSMEEHTGGERHITGFARSQGFRDYRGFGWLVTVRQPADLAFAPVRELQRAVAAWGFLLGTAAIVGSWFAAGRLARRMVIVAAAAERIRTGDILSTMPRPAGHGEMAKMCGALGDMVDELRAKQEKPLEPQPPASDRRPW